MEKAGPERRGLLDTTAVSVRVCPLCAEEFSEAVDTCPNDGTTTQELDPTVVRPMGPAPKGKAVARASSQRARVEAAPAANQSTNKDLARVATGAAAAYAPATEQTPAHQAERTNVAPMPTADNANVAPPSPSEPTVVAEGAEDGQGGGNPFGIPLRQAPPAPPSDGVGRRPTGVEGIPLDTTPGAKFGQAGDSLIGVTVGEYVIRGALGEGGMGMVYEAVHPILGKRVAIKCLRKEVAANPEEAARLLSEAKTAIAIGHRGIIDIFGFGSLPDGRQYFVMEYLNGEPLADRIRPDKELPLGEVLVLLEEILSPLAAAHAAGVIHRDLKPTNIYVVKQPDGATFIKLLDFGLAKQAAVPRGQTAQTNVARILGTPEFMAPEQARGEPVSPRTDLYAFGVIAYELLTATAPYAAESPWEVISMHLTHPVPRVSPLRPDVPPMLDALVQRLMAKEPSARPASAEAVRDEVKRMRKALKLEGTRLELPIVKARENLSSPVLAPVVLGASSKPERLPAPAASPGALGPKPVAPRAGSPGRAAQETSVIPSRKAAAEAARAGALAAPAEASAEALLQVRSSRTGLIFGLVGIVALAALGGLWLVFGSPRSGPGPTDEGLTVTPPVKKLEALPEHVPPPEPPKPEPTPALPKAEPAPEAPKAVAAPEPPKPAPVPEPTKTATPVAAVKPATPPRENLAGRLARVKRAWGAARKAKPDDDVRLFDQMLQAIEQQNKAAGADRASVRKGIDDFVLNALDGKEP